MFIVVHGHHAYFSTPLCVPMFRAGFSLSRALLRKKCGALTCGGRPYFSWKKTGDLFSHQRLSAVSSAVSPIGLFIFCWKTGDLFWSSLSLLFMSPIISGMLLLQKNTAPLLGARFCGGPCSAEHAEHVA